jgi:hypothetical protein
MFSDSLLFEYVDPGTYLVQSPGQGLGGAHIRDMSAIVMVSEVDASIPMYAPSYMSLFSLILLLVLLGSALAVAFGHKRFPARLLPLLVAVWTLTGWTPPPLLPLLASLLAMGALLCSLRIESGGFWVPAALGVLLWPSIPVVVISLLLAAALAAITGLQARKSSPRARRPAYGMAFVVLCAAATSVLSFQKTSPLPPVTESVGGDKCAVVTTEDLVEGMDCFRALGRQLGLELPPREAGKSLLSALKSQSLVGFSQVCRQAGLSLSEAAARKAQTIEEASLLFVEIPPICDYSQMHGIVAGFLAQRESGYFQNAVLELCSLPSPDPRTLSDDEYRIQCWQGVGIAMARRGGFNRDDLELCLRVPSNNTNRRIGQPNCVDGFVREFIDQKTRAVSDPSRRLYKDDISLQALCVELDRVLAEGCYRYIGEESTLDGYTPWEGTNRLVDACRSAAPKEHFEICWYAVGMVGTRARHDEPLDVVRGAVLPLCETAPTAESTVECITGAVNAHMVEAHGKAQLEVVCQWYPANVRQENCARARENLKRFTGISGDE